MTLSANINYWLRADITLKDISSLSTTTLIFVNRAQPLDNDNFYYPLLIGVDGIGAYIDGYLPTADSGLIIVDDTWGSFGVEKKFSDLLQRYSVHQQPYTLYFSKNVVEATEGSSWVSIGSGIIKEWQRDNPEKGATISLTAEPRPFMPKRIGQRVDINSPQMIGIRSSEIGKTLPIVIGQSQVQPIPLNYNSGNCIFGVCADFYTQFTTSDPIGGIRAKAADGEWVSVTNAPSTNIAVSMHSGDTTTNTAGFGASEKAYEVDITSGIYAIMGGRLRYKPDQPGPGADGALTIRCYGSYTPAYGDNRPPIFLLGTATIRKNNYTFNGGGAAAWINFAFDRVIIAKYPRIWFSFAEAGSGNALVPYRYNGGLGVKVWTKTPSTSTALEWSEGTGITNAPTFDVHAIYFEALTPSSSDVDSEGWIPRRVRLNQATVDSGQTITDLRNLPFLLSPVGITDDVSGTISGSPSTSLKPVQYAIKLLSYNWNSVSVAWEADTNWDHSTYSSTHAGIIGIYTRQAIGATTQRQELEALLNDMCRNFCGKIGMSASGKLGFYAWGTTLTAVQTFTQENARVVEFFESDETYVINFVQIAHAKFLEGLDPNSAAAYYNEPNYQALLRWSTSTGVLQANLIGNSVSLYGLRVLEDTLFDWIGSVDGSAETLARFFLTNFNAPKRTVVIEAPFSGNETIKLLDVVNLRFSELPSYYGSSPNALLPTIAGAPLDISSGFTYTRAEEYRAQVEGRKVVFTDEEMPILQLTCRLLLNYPDDPT